MSSTPDLSLLCVTRADACVRPLLAEMYADAQALGAEFVLVADGDDAARLLTVQGLPVAATVNAWGYLESILDDAIDHCHGTYILRLDDDESIDDAFTSWLAVQAYHTSPVWRFPRRHLWQSPNRYIVSPPLWPDYQTRLTISAFAGGRRIVHDASPFGPGVTAPVAIDHFKFLIRDYADRKSIADRYENLRVGAGHGLKFRAFNLPEDVYGDAGPITAPVESVIRP